MATEEEDRDENNTVAVVRTKKSRLLAELCAERHALLQLGGRDDDDDRDGDGDGDGEDGIGNAVDTPRHSLRLLEDGECTT